MRKLIESTFVTLGGDIGAPQDWGPRYLSGSEHDEYVSELLFGADALVLGRKTYEGLSAAYLAMAEGATAPNAFVERMNAIPKYVASTTLTHPGWNATLLGRDVAGEIANLKQQPGKYLLKYGTGSFDQTLLSSQLIDEYRIWIVPVTNSPGQRLFEGVDPTGFVLAGTKTFSSGVVLLTYEPRTSSDRLP